MKINVKRIPVDGERLTGVEPASAMELDTPDIRFQHDIEYDLLAQVQGLALLVTGSLRTPATLRCSRCLKTFELPVVVREFVVHRELQGEDFADLTADIREDILLALPQRALCGEQCKGLCPECGQDLNEKSCQCQPRSDAGRWHVLDQLKLKN
jgi:uncharacterized protein